MHAEKNCVCQQNRKGFGCYWPTIYALCTINNLPVKGQKSITTNFYQARYKESVVISHNFPHDWTPDSAILEGMFIINAKPPSYTQTHARLC